MKSIERHSRLAKGDRRIEEEEIQREVAEKDPEAVLLRVC